MRGSVHLEQNGTGIVFERPIGDSRQPSARGPLAEIEAAVERLRASEEPTSLFPLVRTPTDLESARASRERRLLDTGQRIWVHGRADLEHARRAARALATARGFRAPEVDAVTRVAVELAAALTRHDGGGELRLRAIDATSAAATRTGVEIWSREVSPLEVASDEPTRGGEVSLALIESLVDELLVSRYTAGTTVVARKWVQDTPLAG